MNKQKIILCILDGWGYRKSQSNNAIFSAKTTTYDYLIKNYPNTLLKTSGSDVGLPKGQMGNSEVGHLNIGSGRIIKQDLVRIEESINNGDLKVNKPLNLLASKLKNNNKKCHLIGLLSPGGVHAQQSHILELAKILSELGVKTYIHAILDGRDTPPRSADKYLEKFMKKLPKTSKISSISGRFYAMDRDNRWERTLLYYNALMGVETERTSNPLNLITNFYNKCTYDEFIPPHIAEDYNGIQDGDGLLVANFRADRIRQILNALVLENFQNFNRPTKPVFSSVSTMTSYSQELDNYCDVLFPPVDIPLTLGELYSVNSLKQLRIAETEKYAHVTFFFNGGRETPFTNEERILVPSPNVRTYDEKPEMSAFELTESLTKKIIENNNDLIVVNFANPDMVGHTGNFDAAIAAVETIDICLNKIVEVINKTNSILIITADHGNVEYMSDESSGQPHTAHTTEDVPFIIINCNKDLSLENGRLCDVSPTILDLAEISKPRIMSGKSLIKFL